MRLITINGRIAQDVAPQLSRQGTQFIRFSIASQEYYDEKGSDGKPQPQWYQVTAFEPRLIALSKFLKKGKPVVVLGEYSNRIYQSQKSGMYGIDNNIIANNICFEIGVERQESMAATQNDAPLASEKAPGQVSSAIEEIPQASTRKMTYGAAREKVEGNVSNIEDDLPF